jgi:hypothetical protein
MMADGGFSVEGQENIQVSFNLDILSILSIMPPSPPGNSVKAIVPCTMPCGANRRQD